MRHCPGQSRFYRDDFVRKPVREAEVFDNMAQHLGVRYIYQDLTQFTEQKGAPWAQADLPPADWVAELCLAARRGDSAHMLGLVDQLPPAHDSAAPALTQLVDEFRFDKLIALAESENGG